MGGWVYLEAGLPDGEERGGASAQVWGREAFEEGLCLAVALQGGVDGPPQRVCVVCLPGHALSVGWMGVGGRGGWVGRVKV